MKRTSLVSRNNKFYNIMTILRSLTLTNSPWWSLIQIDMIQIGLESKFDLILIFFLIIYTSGSRLLCYAFTTLFY